MGKPACLGYRSGVVVQSIRTSIQGLLYNGTITGTSLGGCPCELGNVPKRFTDVGAMPCSF